MFILKLLFCVLLAISFEYTVAKEGESLKLKWPKRFTFEAEKISLISGMVEDIRHWRTAYKSRTDFNQGIVKIYKEKPSIKRFIVFGVKYEVHPETTEEEENYIICKRINGTKNEVIRLDDILPSEVDMFRHVGSEIFEQDRLEKFNSYEQDDGILKKNTIWATYNEIKKISAPVRYEQVVFDTDTKTKTSHYIWRFDNFDTSFNPADAFNVTDLNCQDYTTELSKISNLRSDSDNPIGMDHIFSSFKNKYTRIYADEREHILRRNIFQKSMKLVNENNKKNTGYKLTINKFADRTPAEMQKYLGLIRPSQRESDTNPFPYTETEIREVATTLPREFDLRDIGVITPVKDQGECGSCWSFGTTDAVEGVLARNNGGRLLRLSNQAVIDCAWAFGLLGCDGGNDVNSYRWMMKFGLPTEEEYGTYTGYDGICNINNMTEIYSIRGYTNVTPFNNDALKLAIVNHGPLSISIHVTDVFKLYKSGIFYDLTCDPSKVNHEVTLVGYGEQDGEGYWIVKNSWGQTWGMDGYIHISMRDNSCGITAEPSYPVV